MKKSIGPRPLIYPTPVWCIGTYDSRNTPNIMTIAWGGICCSKPPAVAISLRKATYTYGSLLERKAFTVNVPSENYVKEADYFGMVSGKREDKFAKTGLTPVASDLIDAPYVKEFPMILECRVLNVHEIGLHTQFIGEILDIKADPATLNESGWPDMGKVSPFVFGHEIRKYYRIGEDIGEAFSIGKKV